MKILRLFFIAISLLAVTQLNAQNMENTIFNLQETNTLTGKPLVKKLTTGNGYSTISLNFNEGDILAKHTTPVDAYLTCLTGEVLVTIGDSQVVLKPNQLLVLPATIPHEVKAIKISTLLLVK